MTSMTPRPLGKTGLAVSPIGFGAFKIGRNEKVKYPQAYDLPDEATVGRLLNAVLDLGITHVDTAPAYGLSEDRIGRHLAHRRREFFLSTKVGEIFEDGVSRYDFSANGVRRSLEQSLARLRTEVLDLVLIHAPADDLTVLERTEVVSVLQSVRQSGLARAIGFSGKTLAAERLALEWADALMVEFNPQDTSHAPILAEAAVRGVAVLVKKGLASGHLPAEEAIPFVLQSPGVTNLVIGGLNLEHLERNISLAARIG